MKKLIIYILIFFLSSNLFGQKSNFVIYDSISFYYSNSDFSKIDTLSFWNYKLDLYSDSIDNDSINLIGKLSFWRIKPIDDGISKNLYGKHWTPFVNFEIYNLSDSIFCNKQSKIVRIISSCLPPNVGGDLIIMGEFIFLNRSVCLQCESYDTKLDYCRPIIKKLFSELDFSKINTIENIVNQFPINREKQN